eukprot:c16750_g1_i3.p1 GENE.c16750_g1_i3~~c16750_g1_i3.p1  ORF type:complete len:501 (+),score=95.63 c16750_g1_i3:220-1503(+)
MNSFYKYYKGEAEPPCLTIFIGGNHEASNHLLDHFYGGWVSKNIYYLGHAGCVRVGGLRIAGLSGIFNSRDYYKGHYERPPFNDHTIRSAYHSREYDVWRLAQLTPDSVDVFLSHDWPQGIAMHGNTQSLLRRKPFLRDEVMTNTLGSPASLALLTELRPAYWFSAHLHVKFPALVRHQNNSQTKFLSLDKCLPFRDYLQVLDIAPRSPQTGSVALEYDLEWLAIVRASHPHLDLTQRSSNLFRTVPRLDLAPHVDWVKANIPDLTVPDNFQITVQPYSPTRSGRRFELFPETQRTQFLTMLGLHDPFVSQPTLAPFEHDNNPEEVPLDLSVGDEEEEERVTLPSSTNPEEIELDIPSDEEDDSAAPQAQHRHGQSVESVFASDRANALGDNKARKALVLPPPKASQSFPITHHDPHEEADDATLET